MIKKPSDCNKEEIENFHKLVLKGGQVRKSGLKSRIGRAKLLAFHYAGNNLVGIAALKRPNEPYKEDVFRKAGVSEESDKYSLEVGWAFTLPEYRGKGICSGLIKEIMDASESENIFATTKTQNLAMQGILRNYGFCGVGKPYPARTNKHYLRLFIHARIK